eukprot:TRINITY_DN3891_c1_g4_i1.p1 TRINITY_DN3891_c1_g4~~TRINITY_DN3891_c1_g4_i1.p1  ORF type:complete len:285 (+),score=108.28 TRINITY_DN3891_c1_g4_i1:831-1685(+)
MLQQFFATVYKWYLVVRTFFHSIWIVCNSALWQDKLFRAGKVKRKVLFIGDEHALGFGDWVICTQTPGAAKYLRDEIVAGKHVKFTWKCFTQAHPGCTSGDWLPDAKAKPSFLGFLVGGKNLFDSVFAEGRRHADADVIVISVGYNDTGANPEETIDNIRALAKALVAMDKRVFINTMPNKGFLEMKQAKKGWIMSERNTALRKMIEKEDKHIHLGAEVEAFKRQELYSFDGLHLSSKGYRKMAKELYGQMKNPLVNVEWLFLQPKLEEKMKEREEAMLRGMKK